MDLIRVLPATDAHIESLMAMEDRRLTTIDGSAFYMFRGHQIPSFFMDFSPISDGDGFEISFFRDVIFAVRLSSVAITIFPVLGPGLTLDHANVLIQGIKRSNRWRSEMEGAFLSQRTAPIMSVVTSELTSLVRRSEAVLLKGARISSASESRSEITLTRKIVGSVPITNLPPREDVSAAQLQQLAEKYNAK